MDTILAYLQENLVLAIVLLAILALIVVTVIVMIIVGVRDNKRRKAERNAAAAKAQEEPAAEQPVEEPAPAQEQASAPVAEQPAEEKEEEEEKPAPAPAPKAKKAPAKKATPAKGAKEKPAPEKMADPAKKYAKRHTEKATAARKAALAEPKKEGSFGGKWVIKATDSGTFAFELRASNGEKMLGSGEYTTLAGAKRGIETYKTNIAKGNFRVIQTKMGDYIFQLLNGSGQMLGLGADYKTRSRCESAMESTMRWALSETIEIVNDED